MMHPKVINKRKYIRSDLAKLKKQSPLCYKIDKLGIEIKGNEKAKGFDYLISPTNISIHIYIEEVKDIPELLRVCIKYLGRITARYITPKDEHFNFDFDFVFVYFVLQGDVCKRVQIGTETKEIPIYELQCSNGETRVIEGEELKELGKELETDGKE